MKKLTFSLLVFILSVSLFSCGNLSEENTSDPVAEPKLIVSDDSVLEPYSMDWRYKSGNDFVSAEYKGNKDSSSEFEVSGNLLLDFDKQPDHLKVKIMYDNKVIFDDLYKNLTSDIIGNANRKLYIEIDANWYENADNDYYGEAKYIFTAHVTAPASFFIGEDTIEHGELVAITGLNIADLTKIEFNSEPSIEYTPVFYNDGKYAVALVPISIDLEYAPSYTFTLSYNGVTEHLTLNVTERNKTNSIYSNPIPADVMAKRTDSVISSFENSVKDVIATNESTRYWSSVFSTPVTRSVRWGFGRKILLNSSTQFFVNKGVDFFVATGDDVVAVNKGKVVYVGEQEYSGRFVVIDHGFGLKSWYMNMDQIFVEAGDIVETSDPIGTTGKTGFADFSSGGNIHFEITVNGVQVCPYPLQEEGVQITYP